MKPTAKPYLGLKSPGLTAVPNLDQLKIFQCFSDAELSKIQKLCSFQVFQRRQAFFQEGEPLRHVYLILEGHVKFCKKNKRRKETAFGFFNENYFFELMTSDRPGKHSFSAYALGKTIVLKISVSCFRERLMANTAFANHILYQKINTLKRVMTCCMSSGEQVEVRMALMILEILQQPGMACQEKKAVRLEFPLTRRELAEITHTSVETSIRVIGKWMDKGWITMNRRFLIVRNIAAFNKITGNLPRLTG
jgi:CRP/FNR family transcriptional regulator